jgi:hypothetical protein
MLADDGIGATARAHAREIGGPCSVRRLLPEPDGLNPGAGNLTDYVMEAIHACGVHTIYQSEETPVAD